MAAPTFEWTDTQVGDRMDDAARRARLNPTPLSEAVKAAWRSESLTQSVIDKFQGPSFQHDPTYRTDPTWLGEEAKRRGLDMEVIARHLPHARSQAHAVHMLDRMESEQKDQQMLAGAGWTGTAMQIGVGIFDPLSLIANATPAGFLSKGGMIARAAKGGFIAAGQNVALESALGAAQYTRDPEDLFMAGLFGFAIGAPVAGIFGREAAHLRRSAQDAFTETTLRRAAKEGHELTPKGQQTLDHIAASHETPSPAAIRRRGEIDSASAQHPRVPVEESVRVEIAAHVQSRAAAVLDELFPNRGRVEPTGAMGGKITGRMEAWLAKRAHDDVEAWNKAKRDLVGDVVRPDTPPTPAPKSLDPNAKLHAKAEMLAMLRAKVEAQPDLFASVKAAADEAPDVPTPKAPDGDAPAAPVEKTPEVTPEVKPEAPAPTPDESPITVGDDVTWDEKGGAQGMGVVEKVKDGTYYVRDEVTGKIRTFKPKELMTFGDDEIPEPTFGPHSVGGAQIGGIAGYIETGGDAWTHIKIGRWEIPIRFDYFARFVKSKNPVVRDIGRMLLFDNVGNKDGSPVALSASEFAEMERRAYRGRFYVEADKAFRAYADRQGYNWTQRLQSSVEAEAFFGVAARITRGDANLAAQWPEAAAFAKVQSTLYQELLEKMKLYGVEGAEEIDVNPRYIMRRNDMERHASLTAQHGERVNELWRGAIQNARRDLDPEKVKRIADGYLDKIATLRMNPEFNKMWAAKKDLAYMRDLLATSKLDEDEIDVIMDLLYSGRQMAPEGASHARLKKRTTLDETFEMVFEDGTRLKISDFFVNDSRLLFDIYSKQTTGLIALAKSGIKSEGDWDKLKQKVVDYYKARPDIKVDGATVQKEVQEMDDIRAHMLGRPMSNERFGTGERVARVLRDVNFFRMMGQAGFAQIPEIGNLIGLSSWRAVSLHMPEVKNLIHMAKGRALDDELGRTLINMGGFGSEIMANTPLHREVAELDQMGNLTRAELASRKLAHATSYASGMASVNTVLKNLAGRAYLQHYADIANGRVKFDKELKRLASNGMSEADAKRMLEQFKKYVHVEGKTGKIERIDWDEWKMRSPKTADMLRTAMFRDVNRAVQEHTIGETAPWMHSTVGKILTQFRSFSLVAWNKQLLHGINHADMHTLLAWSASMLFGGLAYTAQTTINFAHNPEKLEERLSLWKIATASFQRAGFSSLMPMGIDFAGDFFFDQQVFAHGRTTGLGAGPLIGNPTYDLLWTKLAGTLSEGSQTLLNDDHVWTSSANRNALGMLMSNVVGVRNVVDAMSSDLPTRQPDGRQ